MWMRIWLPTNSSKLNRMCLNRKGAGKMQAKVSSPSNSPESLVLTWETWFSLKLWTTKLQTHSQTRKQPFNWTKVYYSSKFRNPYPKRSTQRANSPSQKYSKVSRKLKKFSLYWIVSHLFCSPCWMTLRPNTQRRSTNRCCTLNKIPSQIHPTCRDSHS